MDWFEHLTGFREADATTTRARLRVDDGWLVNLRTGARHRIGTLECPTLQALRDRARAAPAGRSATGAGTRTRVRCLAGEARALHADPAHAGALFQVASQFNLLEMIGPEITPEQGVTRYASDLTQGPACAVACGAGTIWRHHLIPLDGGIGQRAGQQIDTSAGLRAALAARLGCAPRALWTTRNGYALPEEPALQAIARLLEAADEATREALRGTLAVGLQRETEVTVDARGEPRAAIAASTGAMSPTAAPCVSQVYASAMPVAYSRASSRAWAPLARLVLEAAYEATLRLAAEQAARGGSRTVLLTRLGGGAFGNDDAWIDAAIVRALACVADAGLDVRLVSFRTVEPAMAAIARGWEAAG